MASLSSKGYSNSKSGSQTKKNVTTTKINLPTKTTGQNLTSKGYPGSVGTYNLTTKGYSGSRDGSAGTGNVSTTKVTLPTSSSSSGYSSGGYSSGYSGGSSRKSGGYSYDPDYSAVSAQAQADADAARIAEAQAQAAKEAQQALLLAIQKQQQQYEEQLRQKKEAAQGAYNRNMSALNSAYDSQIGSLSSNLADTKNQLLNQYNNSQRTINQDAENSLRQAYVNRMLSEKNLAQQMSAMGLTGGATETTLAGMLNNYGNARNNINTTLNKNLSDLSQNYNSNVSQALQAYNNAKAQADAQKTSQVMALENALSNNEISALSDYQNLLQKDNSNYVDLLKSVIANAQNFAYTPSEVINSVAGQEVSQSNPTTNTTNYAALQQLLNAANGTAGNNVVSLSNPTTTNNYLAAILKQLGA